MRYVAVLLLLSTLTGCGCDDIWSIATLRHLPIHKVSRDCDSLFCDDEAKTAEFKWADEIDAIAERQTNAFARKEFHAWAWFYREKAKENNSYWKAELRARLAEKSIKE